MAHAALIARHRLNDQQLALKYARAIADGTDGPSVPSRTKQMYISLLAVLCDLGEHKAARILLGGLIASGTVTDAHEQHVLLERLKEPESVENSSVSLKP